MKKIAFLFIVLATVQVSAQQTWKTISQNSYSIKYPSDWVADTASNIGADLLLYNEEDAADGFAENINVVVQDLAGYDLDLDGFTELSEGQIKTMVEGVKIISSERVTKGAIPYHRMVYTGEQSGVTLKFLQHFYVKNEKAYVLTLTSMESEFYNYVKIGSTIFKSFRLK
ncbi:MAG: PsbP-related protein [Bacteroidota bacterium]